MFIIFRDSPIKPLNCFLFSGITVMFIIFRDSPIKPLNCFLFSGINVLFMFFRDSAVKPFTTMKLLTMTRLGLKMVISSLTVSLLTMAGCLERLNAQANMACCRLTT